MSINQFGEITLPKEEFKRGLSPAQELTLLCHGALSSGNVLPPGIELEENVTLYYKPKHIKEMKDLLEQIIKFSTENHISNLKNPDGSTGIDVNTAIQQIQKNIDFSEKINAELEKNPIVETKIINEEQFQENRKKLLEQLRRKKV